MYFAPRLRNLSRSFLLALIPVFTISAAFSLPGSCQVITGTILGTITDQSGGAVANAKVTVTNMRTGLTRSGTTEQQGDYLIPLLPLGQYKVEVVATGFALQESTISI